MKSTFSLGMAFLFGLLLICAGCNHSSTTDNHPVPTPEDIKIGRQAISINEVSLLARTGFHKEALDAVKRRHVPEMLSAEDELKLRDFAKPELLAALKDPENILSPAQKDAYDEAKGKQTVQAQQTAATQTLQANNQRAVASAAADQAWSASVADQQETERRRRLNQEASYAAEQAKAERAQREREQLRSTEEKWRMMDAQNSYHRPYNTPVPNRRLRTDPNRQP
jgi:hypothetical protein